MIYELPMKTATVQIDRLWGKTPEPVAALAVRDACYGIRQTPHKRVCGFRDADANFDYVVTALDASGGRLERLECTAQASGGWKCA